MYIKRVKPPILIEKRLPIVMVKEKEITAAKTFRLRSFDDSFRKQGSKQFNDLPQKLKTHYLIRNKKFSLFGHKKKIISCRNQQLDFKTFFREGLQRKGRPEEQFTITRKLIIQIFKKLVNPEGISALQLVELAKPNNLFQNKKKLKQKLVNSLNRIKLLEHLVNKLVFIKSNFNIVNLAEEFYQIQKNPIKPKTNCHTQTVVPHLLYKLIQTQCNESADMMIQAYLPKVQFQSKQLQVRTQRIKRPQLSIADAVNETVIFRKLYSLAIQQIDQQIQQGRQQLSQDKGRQQLSQDKQPHQYQEIPVSQQLQNSQVPAQQASRQIALKITKSLTAIQNPGPMQIRSSSSVKPIQQAQQINLQKDYLQTQISILKLRLKQIQQQLQVQKVRSSQLISQNQLLTAKASRTDTLEQQVKQQVRRSDELVKMFLEKSLDIDLLFMKEHQNYFAQINKIDQLTLQAEKFMFMKLDRRVGITTKEVLELSKQKLSFIIHLSQRRQELLELVLLSLKGVVSSLGRRLREKMS